AVDLRLGAARVEVAAGGYRLPHADELAGLVGDLGIGPDTHVVIYDDSGGLDAARFFFTLDVFGHRAVSILDGGIAAWRRGKLPLTIETARVARTAYRPVLLADRVASAEWVRGHLTDATVALLYGWTAAEYAGQDVRASRGGSAPPARGASGATAAASRSRDRLRRSGRGHAIHAAHRTPLHRWPRRPRHRHRSVGRPHRAIRAGGGGHRGRRLDGARRH